jgi:putative FmdB family regulatory protein
MPFYEYVCTKCGHEEEVLQKIGDQPLKKCPACGKSSMVKKVSAAAFRLKGGGWYETDFKKDKQKNLSVADKPEKGKSEKKSNDSAAKGQSGAKGGTTTTTKKAKN